MNVRVAIVGLGDAARRIHLPAYAKLRAVHVVGGCDAIVRTGKFAFPVFESIGEMIDETKPDVLVVATPPATHAELVRTGLEAGCHIVCEKPFVRRVDEGLELIELAERCGRWIVVNNQYRYMKMHRAAKELIRTAEFGDLLFLQAQQTVWQTAETENEGWRRGEGLWTCREFGTHVFDLCRYFFGENPRQVRASMPGRKSAAEPDRVNLIELEFSGERVAAITLDRMCRGPHRYLDLRLDGTTGCIETHLGGGAAITAGVRGGTRRPFMEWDVAAGGRARLYHGEAYRTIATDPLDLFAMATARLMEDFVGALEVGGVPACRAVDNLANIAIMEGAYRSAIEGQGVEVSLPSIVRASESKGEKETRSRGPSRQAALPSCPMRRDAA